MTIRYASIYNCKIPNHLNHDLILNKARRAAVFKLTTLTEKIYYVWKHFVFIPAWNQLQIKKVGAVKCENWCSSFCSAADLPAGAPCSRAPPAQPPAGCLHTTLETIMGNGGNITIILSVHKYNIWWSLNDSYSSWLKLCCKFSDIITIVM